MMMEPKATIAIDILSGVQERLPSGLLAHLTSPNCILSLSGARPLLDQVHWPQGTEQAVAWESEMDSVLGALEEVCDVYCSDVTSGQTAPSEGEPRRYVSFDVVLRPALEVALATTTLLDKEHVALPDNPSYRSVVEAAIANALQHTEEFQAHNYEKLGEAARGILFGYPDIAIRSLLYGDQEGSVFAKINGSDYYDCPQPLCMYPARMAFDPTIKQHQSTWAEVLEHYYTSSFHADLEADSDYNAKLVELGMVYAAADRR